jgi:hypothetical protein
MSWAVLAVPVGRACYLVDRSAIRLGHVPLGIRYAHGPNITLPTPPRISTLDSPSDTAEARSWIAKFNGQSIPKSLVEVTFSRSSGPGGQVRPVIHDCPRYAWSTHEQLAERE